MKIINRLEKRKLLASEIDKKLIVFLKRGSFMIIIIIVILIFIGPKNYKQKMSPKSKKYCGFMMDNFGNKLCALCYRIMYSNYCDNCS